MTASETLEQCRTIIAEIDAIQSMIDRLSDTGAPAGDAPNGFERVGGATNNKQAARLQAVDGCMQVLDARNAALIGCIAAAEELIAMLDDSRARTVLRYYYCTGYSDKQIAKILETTRETVTRRRNKALSYLSVKSQEVTKKHTTSH